MSYKIAVASSDGKNVDLALGAAEEFYIYEATDDGKIDFAEIRKTQETECGHIPKLNLIRDCKCLLCKKIGYQAVKQFEKNGITVFDIEYDINGALEKIVSYYKKVT